METSKQGEAGMTEKDLRRYLRQAEARFMQPGPPAGV